MKKRQRISGIRISYIFLPTIIIIGIIHILIIICTLFINSNTKKLSDESQKTTNCIDDITVMLSYTSKLSDTIGTFIYTPVIPAGPNQGQLNTGPLNAYYSEIADTDKGPNAFTAKIRTYHLAYKEQVLIDDSINCLKRLIEYQNHAMRLINDKVALPENVLARIGEYELTDAEKAYTLEEAKTAALNILFSQEYSLENRDFVSKINEAQKLIVQSSNEVQQSYNNKISVQKILLWVFISSILVVTVLFIVLLLYLLVIPLIKSTRKIYANERLGENNTLYETNLLAKAYNSLLDRHIEFEVELRNVAERDSLTGLPNRYSYNEFLKKPASPNTSCCAFLFDINRLKYTNDTFGHSAGDVLIKKASLAIIECFQDGDNCYRIGGDEFVAILNNIERKEIDEYVADFHAAEEKYDVSVAMGFAYTTNVAKQGYEKLISEADTLMYENKRGARGEK